MKKIAALLALCAPLMFTTLPAYALEAYSQAQEQQFVSWCTGAKSASESTCSCTVKRLATTVPATALSQFIANGGKLTMDSSLMTTTAMVAEAFTACSK
ncbi:MAG: hypothetical protein OQJ97_16120 [Rhodospirillales bacterium]|nr:hypothetical protein [Rhodospirillales bacterium]